MNRKISPTLRCIAGLCLCFFCLLRPLWGWLDRKIGDPQSIPSSMQEAGESPKREANVLGEMLASKLSAVAHQAPGAK